MKDSEKINVVMAIFMIVVFVTIMAIGVCIMLGVIK